MNKTVRLTYEEYKKLTPEQLSTIGCVSISAMPDSVNEWFELTYASYAVLPRSILQSMPEEWQDRFVGCMKELSKSFDWTPKEGQIYRVSLHEIDETAEQQFGDEIPDPLLRYRNSSFKEIESRRKTQA